MNSQKGYLLFVAVLLMSLVSVIISASYMFISSTQSMSHTAQAQKAFYIAVSGLEVGSRYLLSKKISCENITNHADLTNQDFGGGQYSVTGSANNKNTTLSNALNIADNTISLASTAGFPSSGVVSIDDEYIFYSSMVGNSLINVSRGIAGSVPAAHINSSKVIQMQCLLTSTGGYPNLIFAVGKGTVQRFYIGKNFQVPINSITYRNSPVVAVSSVTLNNDASIINPNVTTTSSNYNGSTIVSRGKVTLNKNGATMINSPSGLVISSSKNNLQQDIMQNNTMISKSNLFGFFFNQSKATIRSGANQSYNSSNINGAAGVTIWIAGNLTLNGSTTVGTPNKPVILIVNGNLTLNNTASIYGFVYATGNISLNKTNMIRGSAASESNIVLNFDSLIQYDQSILGEIQEINNSLTTTYVQTPAATLELYA